MHKSDSRNNLLIALPKEFGFRSLFKNKLRALTHTLGEFDVSVVQDQFGFVRDYFEGTDVTITSVDLPKKVSLKTKLKDFTHILVFWDGEEFTSIIYFAMYLKIPLRTIPVQVTKVRNKDKDEEFDVYIGRGTPWGNPFPIGMGGTGDSREIVIEKFRKYFEDEVITNPEKRSAFLSLRGMRLGCHCKPFACHGDIIARFLNNYEEIAEEAVTQ